MTKFFTVEGESSRKLTLNRPEKGNAFHHEMILELTELFKKFNNDSRLKSIFISGNGKHFCTGADLAWMKNGSTLSESENVGQMKDLLSMYLAINACPVPITTFVHGCVYGGGIGLCSLSDYVISHQSSIFSLSEMKYGLLPGAVTPFLLNKIGRTQFMQLALEAKPFHSQKALELGFITAIGSLGDAVKKWEEFNQYPAVALRNLKKSVQLFVPDVDIGMDKLKYLSAECRSSKESIERIDAFLNNKNE